MVKRHKANEAVSVANYLHRMEPISFTPYMDDCLRILQEEKEAPTDALLIQLVRVQLIRDKASSLIKIGPTPISGTTNPLYVSGDFHIQTLVSQLEEVDKSIPETVKSNGKSPSSTPFSNGF
jgi:hypothetical protein